MNGKEGIIKEAYETNFGTSYGTCKIAVEKSPNIILQDAKDYLNKRGDTQGTLKHKTYNSFVSPGKLMSMQLIL